MANTQVTISTNFLFISKQHGKSSKCLSLKKKKKKKGILLLITYSKSFPVQLPIFLMNYLSARPFNACLRLCDFAIPEYILALWSSQELLQNASNFPALLMWTGLQEKVSALSTNRKHNSYNIQGKMLPKIDRKTLIVWIPCLRWPGHWQGFWGFVLSQLFHHSALFHMYTTAGMKE